MMTIFLLFALQDFCMVCHSEIRGNFTSSIHYMEEIDCTSCHGGKKGTKEIKEAHSGDFKGVPDRKEIVELCGSCHSKPEKMRAYGLSTDQEVLYWTSVHGRELKKGDTRVAVCSDCHGSHLVLPSQNPKSLVFKKNEPSTCGKCHSDPKLMKSYGLSPEIVLKYRASVHSSALFEKGNMRSPTCSTCHGSHGATPPGIGDINKVCGQCHSRTRAFFLESPHAGLENFPECSSCHRIHRIEPTNHGLFKVCSNCHRESGGQVKKGEEFYSLMTDARNKIEKAEELIKSAERIPVDVEDHKARLEEAETYLIEALPLSHTLDYEKVKEIVGKANSISEEVSSEVTGKKGIVGTRKLIVLVLWFYIFITVVAIYQLKKSYYAE